MRKMNGTTVPLWVGRGLTKIALACSTLLMAGSFSAALAGTEMKSSDSKEIAPPSCGEKDWTIELGTGVSWSNVRHGEPNAAYTVVPTSLNASLKLDDVSLDNFCFGIFRGYSEFFFRGDYEQIVHGPENHWAGIMVGPRYNFVQPGWKIIPYVEGGVGVGFVDSNPAAGGFGQDFNFTFEAGAGAKYLISDCWYARLGVEYQHISNAGLSEPEFPNHPIDELGPKLSFGYAF